MYSEYIFLYLRRILVIVSRIPSLWLSYYAVFSTQKSSKLATLNSKLYMKLKMNMSKVYLNTYKSCIILICGTKS